MTISQATLLDYLNDGLSAAERERVAAALERDAGLRAELEQLRRLERGLRATFDAIYDARLPAATLGERRMEPTRRIRLLPGLGLAGALAAALLLAMLWVRPDGAAPAQTGNGGQGQPGAATLPGAAPTPVPVYPGAPTPRGEPTPTPIPADPGATPTPVPVYPGAPTVAPAFAELGTATPPPGGEPTLIPAYPGAATPDPDGPTIVPTSTPLAVTSAPGGSESRNSRAISPSLGLRQQIGGIVVAAAVREPLAYAITMDLPVAGMAQQSQFVVYRLGVEQELSLIAETDLPPGSHGLELAGDNLLVVTETGFWLFDASDPAFPIRRSTVDSLRYVKALALDGQRAYVVSDGRTKDDNASLAVFDISYPDMPRLLGSSELASLSANDLAVAGGIAYAADEGGLTLYDVADPSASVWLGAYESPNARALALDGGRAYLASDVSLSIVDVADPAHPATLGLRPLDLPGTGVALDGTVAYVAVADLGSMAGGGADVIDASDPAAPALLGRYRSRHNALGVVAAGSRFYVANDTDGLLALNRKQP